MIVNYTGGTGQQRVWFESALAHMQFPWDSLTALTVNVSWPDEPSAPGHKEYACMTQQADYNHFSLEIRNTLDTDVGYLARNSPLGDGRPPSSLESFYVECVAHELGHILWFHLIDSPTPPSLAPICAWFVKHEQGTGEIIGTPADLHPAGANWEDMLQEGIAETLKDALLPEGFMEYDNRTKWTLKKENYEAFMSLFINTVEGGAGTERVRVYEDTSSPGTPGFIPVMSGWGLTYITDEQANHLKPNEGYPRIRYTGSHFGTPIHGVIDFPDFWTPGHPLGHHDGQLLDPTHRQNAIIDEIYDDTGVYVGPEPLITDPEGPVVGGNPYASLAYGGLAIYGFAGLVQISQFEPDPLGVIPPFPYKDPQLAATNALWAAVRFKTR
jgi:hypothetical protein